jgi:hypothetical protein
LTPTTDAFKSIVAHVVGESEKHSPAAALAGILLSAYVVAEVDRKTEELRWALESHFTGPEMAAARDFALELDLDNKSPDDFGFATYILYRNYQSLIGWTRSVAEICCGKLDDLPGYEEWHKLDQALTERLREIFAIAELEGYRADLEEAFKH